MKRNSEERLPTSGEPVIKDDDMNLGRILFSWLGLSTVTSHPHVPVASSFANAARVPKVGTQQWVSTPFSANTFDQSTYNQIVQRALKDSVHEPINTSLILQSTVLGRVLSQNKALMSQGKLSYFSLFMQTPKGLVTTHVNIHALLVNPQSAMSFFKRFQPHPGRWLGTFTTHEDVAALAIRPMNTLSVAQLMSRLNDSEQPNQMQQNLVTLLSGTDDHLPQGDFFLQLMSTTIEMTQSWVRDSSENSMRKKSSVTRPTMERRTDRAIYGFGFEASAARFSTRPANELAQDSFVERWVNWLWGSTEPIEPSERQIELQTYTPRPDPNTSDVNNSVMTNETRDASQAHDITRLASGEFSQAVILGVTSTDERHLLTMPVSRLSEFVNTTMLRAFMASIDDSHRIQWLGLFVTDKELQQLREQQASFGSVTMLSQESINELLTDDLTHDNTAIGSLSLTGASMVVDDMTRLLGGLNTPQRSEVEDALAHVYQEIDDILAVPLEPSDSNLNRLYFLRVAYREAGGHPQGYYGKELNKLYQDMRRHISEQKNAIRREEEQRNFARPSSTTQMTMAMNATAARPESKPEKVKTRGMPSMGSNISTSGGSNKKLSIILQEIERLPFADSLSFKTDKELRDAKKMWQNLMTRYINAGGKKGSQADKKLQQLLGISLRVAPSTKQAPTLNSAVIEALKQKIQVVNDIHDILKKIRQNLDVENGRTLEDKIGNFTKQQERFMEAVVALSASMQTTNLSSRQEENMINFLLQKQREVSKLADEVASYRSAVSMVEDGVHVPSSAVVSSSHVDASALNPDIFFQHLATMSPSVLAQVVMQSPRTTDDILSVWSSSEDVDNAFTSVVRMAATDESMASVVQVCELMAITPHGQLVLQTKNVNDVQFATLIDVDLLLSGTQESAALFRQLQAFLQQAMSEGVTVQMDVMVPNAQGQLGSVRRPYLLTSQQVSGLVTSPSMVASLPKPLYSADEKRRFLELSALWRVMVDSSHARQQHHQLPTEDSIIGVGHHHVPNVVETHLSAPVTRDEQMALQKSDVLPITSTDAPVIQQASLTKKVSVGSVFRYDPSLTKESKATAKHHNNLSGKRIHQESIMAKSRPPVMQNETHVQGAVDQLSNVVKALARMRSAIEHHNAERYLHETKQIATLLKELKKDKSLTTRKQQDSLRELSQEYTTLDAQGKAMHREVERKQEEASRHARPDTTKMAKLVSEVLASVRGRGNNTELNITEFDKAKAALAKLKELRQQHPNARLSTFEMTNLAAAVAVIEQGAHIEEALVQAEDVVEDMTPRQVAGQFLSGMLSLPSSVSLSSTNQTHLQSIAAGVAADHGALTTFKGSLNMQLATLAATESAEIVEALVEGLTDERNMLIAQLMETGVTAEEAKTRAEAAVEQLVSQVIVPLASGAGQFIYVVMENDRRELTLTSVSAEDFGSNMTVRRNLLMSAMMSNSTSGIMWGVASSEQMAALDVAISHNLLVAGSSELPTHISAVMQLADGLSTGGVPSADAMALMSPAAQGMLLQQGQRRELMDAMNNARTRYDLSLSTGGERKPMSLKNIGDVMQGLTAMLLAVRNMTMARTPTHGKNRTMNHGMMSSVGMIGGTMPTLVASAPSQSMGAPSPLPGRSPREIGPVFGPQKPPVQKVPRGMDKTSPEGLFKDAKQRVDDRLMEIAMIIIKISELKDDTNLREEHQGALDSLAVKLGTHLYDFEKKQGTQAFMTMKDAMMGDIKQAEKAFAKEPGIWSNYVKPLVNALIYALQAIMSFVKIPETYQPTMFKTKAENVWDTAGLKSQLDKIFENTELLQDIKDIEQRGPQQ
jgi:hypothetical protein